MKKTGGTIVDLAASLEDVYVDLRVKKEKGTAMTAVEKKVFTTLTTWRKKRREIVAKAQERARIRIAAYREKIRERERLKKAATATLVNAE